MGDEDNWPGLLVSYRPLAYGSVRGPYYLGVGSISDSLSLAGCPCVYMFKFSLESSCASRGALVSPTRNQLVHIKWTRVTHAGDAEA